VGEKLGSAQEFRIVELPKRLFGEPDFGDPEAREMRRHLRQTGQHRRRGWLEHCV
jgi:hypothetical protein